MGLKKKVRWSSVKGWEETELHMSGGFSSEVVSLDEKNEVWEGGKFSKKKTNSLDKAGGRPLTAVSSDCTRDSRKTLLRHQRNKFPEGNASSYLA